MSQSFLKLLAKQILNKCLREIYAEIMNRLLSSNIKSIDTQTIY